MISSPWRKPEVARGQLELIRNIRANASDAVSSRMLGILQTTWVSPAAFMKAYFGGGGHNGALVDYQRNGATSWDGAPSTIIGTTF